MFLASERNWPENPTQHSLRQYGKADVGWLNEEIWVSNIPKIHDLKSEIANCKQGEMTIIEYYAKLVGLWNELDGKTTQHLCTCGKCECNLGEKILQALEQEKSH